MPNLKNIVNSISSGPIWLGELLVNINKNPSLIFGKTYDKNYKVFNQKEIFRTNDLLDVVNYSLANVPYYKDLYNGLKINSIEEFENIIDFIEKDTVLNDLNKFLSTDFSNGKYDLVTTGGTTGTPMKLYVPKDRYKVELAAVHSAWNRVGYNFSKRAVLRNSKVIDRPYEINPITREYIFDGFNLTESNFYHIYNVMKKRNIKFLHAYTSNAFAFSKFLVSHKLDVSFIHAFLTASENVYPHQHEYITNTAGIRHYNIYGHSEKLAFAGFCKDSDIYHFEPSYGYVELINDNNLKVCTPGEIGEIVASTISNKGMPLIRYKTGDYAEYAYNECPNCGHKGLSVKRILGRWGGDKIYNLDGSYVTTTALNLHNSIYEKIEGLQYYQPKKGVLDIRVIPNKNFNADVVDQLRNVISTKLSLDSVVNIVQVNSLEKNRNGKFLLLVSDI